MNIFQKFREVKLPFLAVVAALAFGGIVAPASAAAPTASNFSTLPSSTGVYINFNASGATQGSGCKVVVRSSNAPAPSSSDVVSATSAVSPDIAYQLRSLTLNPETFNLSGLTASTSYNYYVVCFESGLNNPTATPYSGTFTTMPAATAPTISNLSSSTVSSTSTSLSFTSSGNGVCSAVVRLAADAVPTSNYIVNASSPVSPDQAVVARPVSAGQSSTFTFTGMMQGSTYSAYIACQDGGATVTSNTYTFGFTQQVGGGFSYSTCNPAITVTSIGYANGRTTLAPGETYSRIYNNDPSIVSANGCSAAFAGNVAYGYRATLDGVQVHAYSNPASAGNIIVRTNSFTYENLIANPIFNGRTINQGSVYTISYYVGLTSTPTSSDTPTFSLSLTLNPNGGGSSPTTAAVQRPLPQINFAANPVNGVSARPTADTRKGTLTIEGSNLSDLTSITIGGKAATFTVKDGKLDIKLPAGVTGFPEVVMTNASGSITMQNAIEIYAPTVQKLTKFVGDRLTLAGMETLENLYINNKTATALEATVVVSADATEAEIAKAVAAATKAVTYIDKVGKRIVRTAVTVSKTGEAGTKPSIEMSFTK